MTAVDSGVGLAWPGGPVLLSTPDLDRGHWLGIRRRGIGGSDVPGILGLSRWASPLSVYMDKLGELTDSDPGEAAEWGNLLEPVVADKWSRDSGIATWPVGTVAHPERTWQLASLDRVYGDPQAEVPAGGLEVKTTNQYLSDDWDSEEGRMPDAARLQVQHYMDVTGLREFTVAALIGGQSLRVFRETYDAELAEMIRTEAERFWTQHVLTHTPPPIDGSRITADLLGRLYEVELDELRVLDALEVRSLLEAREHAAAVMKGAEADLDLANNKLKALLGPKTVGVVGGQPVVTWKPQTRAEHVVKESTFRVLRVKKGALDACI